MTHTHTHTYTQKDTLTHKKTHLGNQSSYLKVYYRKKKQNITEVSNAFSVYINIQLLTISSNYKQKKLYTHSHTKYENVCAFKIPNEYECVTSECKSSLHLQIFKQNTIYIYINE